MRVDGDLSMGSVCTVTRTFKTNCGYSFCIVLAVIDACEWIFVVVADIHSCDYGPQSV